MIILMVLALSPSDPGYFDWCRRNVSSSDPDAKSKIEKCLKEATEGLENV